MLSSELESYSPSLRSMLLFKATAIAHLDFLLACDREQIGSNNHCQTGHCCHGSSALGCSNDDSYVSEAAQLLGTAT